MAIKEINTLSTGQIGIDPRRVTIISTDNLATVTTAGYLNQKNLQGFTISSTDEISMYYGYVSPANPGIFAIFTASIAANGVITLVEWTNGGDVLLPVVSNDFAVFNGTQGQIKDAGYSPSDATKTKVAMVNSAVSGQLVSFSDANGTVSTNGFAMKSVASAGITGGAAAQTIIDAFCTTGSVVIGNFVLQTNAVSVLKITPGNGSFVVTANADPGGSTFSYIITK